MASSNLIYYLLLLNVARVAYSQGIMYPQQSETREVFDLSGIWKFRLANRTNPDEGFVGKWYNSPLEQTGPGLDMPVPSSYNDITQDAAVRDHVGWVWYDTEFFVPARFQSNYRLSIRFGSANYYTVVWLNGNHVTNHSGGYLPFEGEVTNFITYGQRNRLTVAVNNTLTPWTIPQGRIEFHNDTTRYPPGFFVQKYNFDFFNYGGIHRPVKLSVTPKSYIDDLTVITDFTDNQATLAYSVGIKGPATDYYITVELYDTQRSLVAEGSGLEGRITFSDPHLWWPRGMNSEVAYLYNLRVLLWDTDRTTLIDTYNLRVGIRTITWSNDTLLINGKPIYFKGFGKHEDSILRGKGLDLVTLVKDFNLMEWTEANSFRTSHYPYAEELMDLADSRGFMIIDEVPAVALDTFDTPLLEAHLQTLKELVQRDKNRPSVVMWSLANEPQSQKAAARPYFAATAEYVRSVDATRPITLVLNKQYSEDVTGDLVDVICINRYFSWYSDTGHTELVEQQMINDATAWNEKYHKLIIVSEYGADTITGLHSDPPLAWTEDYQVEMMSQYFSAFDDLRQKGLLVGEMIWNFADFATPQSTTRAIINRKGIFTRERQPKASARHLRNRYSQLK